MKSPTPSIKPWRRPQIKHSGVLRFESAKLWAPIVASLMLGLSGLVIQYRASDAALKKDYVAAALSILKEKPSEQDAELRTWALKVFSEHSPVPLPSAAQKSLYQGPVVLGGLPFFPPPEVCLRPPEAKPVLKEFEQLQKRIEKAGTAEGAIQVLIEFSSYAAKQSLISDTDRFRHNCMLRWAANREKDDIEYRADMGMESSKDLIARYRKAREAKEAASAASAASAP
ncbi:hypothetical protein [Acidovorax sp. SUPP3334]|uniref:hypothetical protein n=1 Tax=Acidovorax sp. SUPP3334 TaxID=2920881 RepID=UPI0023DE1A80|nr:hypothetical protein [Acidovorax sp. SUPP3334]GKT21657.1 hypothetical protein AVHM3334_05550 [Acidovorax sp. SUPP3334]